MRQSFGFLGLWVGIVALAGAQAAHATCPVPTGIDLKVPPGASQVVLAGVPSASAGATVTVVAPPLHGELELFDQDYHYRPRAAFWTLGSDRFLLKVQDVAGRSEVLSVRIFPATKRIIDQQEDFEPEVGMGKPWQRIGPPSFAVIGKSARMNGAYGLEVIASPAESVVGVRTTVNVLGGGAQGSGATGGWRPPGGPPGADCEGPCTGPVEATVLSHLDADLVPKIWVRMRHTDSGVSVQLQTAGALSRSNWAAVSDAEHEIEILTRVPYQGQAGTSLLWIDGELVDQLDSSDITHELVENGHFEFGLRNVQNGAVSSHFDLLTAYHLDSGQMAATVECEDDFDAPILDPLWHVYGPSENLQTFSALYGTGSLVIDPSLGGIPPGGLVIARDLDEKSFGRLGLRLEVDLSETVVPGGTALILIDSENTFGSRTFRVVVDGLGGGSARMRVFARHDDFALAPALATFPITLGRHTLELDWRRSTTNAKGLGTLRVWLDGIEKVDHRGVMNPTMTLRDLRFGAVSNVGLATGKVRFDQIEMWTEP